MPLPEVPFAMAAPRHRAQGHERTERIGAVSPRRTRMLVMNVMTRGAECVRPSNSLQEAAQRTDSGAEAMSPHKICQD
jgi:hypothetical protein